MLWSRTLTCTRAHISCLNIRSNIPQTVCAVIPALYSDSVLSQTYYGHIQSGDPGGYLARHVFSPLLQMVRAVLTKT